MSLNAGAIIVQMIREWAPFSASTRARRAAKKAARKARRDGPQPDIGAGEFLQPEEDMDIQAFVIQVLLAAIRHGLTAVGALGIVGSEDSMAQIAGVVALVVGGVWSLVRKWTAAKIAA